MIKESHKCFFCNQVFSLIDSETYFSEKKIFPRYELEMFNRNNKNDMATIDKLSKGKILYSSDELSNYKLPTKKVVFLKIEMFNCPNCQKVSTKLTSNNPRYGIGEIWFNKPEKYEKTLPDYIPQNIREDYIEGCKIMELSPKASATMMRRTLQEMISNKFNIKEGNLYKQIDKVKDKTEPKIFQAINDIRQMGNIGAHMNQNNGQIVDIDQDEAENLLDVVNLLIQTWYVQEHETNVMLEKLHSTNESKKNHK